MIVLTGLIALATIINIWVFYKESEDAGTQTTKLANKAGEIVGTMNTALDNNRDAVSKAFDANRNAVAASEEQSKKALDASITIANNAQRAWVSSKIEVTSPMNFTGGAAFLPLSIEMTNMGHSPAESVFPLERLVVSMGGPLPKSQIRNICGELKQPRQPQDANGWTLFPGQTAISTVQGAGVGREVVGGGIANPFFPGKLGFALVTCVDYTMTFDGRKHHQTIQTYSISFPGNMGVIAPVGNSPVFL